MIDTAPTNEDLGIPEPVRHEVIGQTDTWPSSPVGWGFVLSRFVGG